LLIHSRTFPNKVFSGRGGSDYHHARFSGSGWCAPISGSYLLIDLQKEYHITRIAIMGNKDQTKWSSSYAMQYSQTKTSLDDGPSVQVFVAVVIIIREENIRESLIHSLFNIFAACRLQETITDTKHLSRN
jgi:hypothetical protein